MICLRTGGVMMIGALAACGTAPEEETERAPDEQFPPRVVCPETRLEREDALSALQRINRSHVVVTDQGTMTVTLADLSPADYMETQQGLSTVKQAIGACVDEFTYTMRVSGKLSVAWTSASEEPQMLAQDVLVYGMFEARELEGAMVPTIDTIRLTIQSPREGGEEAYWSSEMSGPVLSAQIERVAWMQAAQRKFVFAEGEIQALP